MASIFLVACGRDNSQDHLARAKELAAKNDHRGAVIELKNALQGNSQSPEARFLLGRELLEQGDPKNAEIELQKAYDQKYDPDQAVPLLIKSQMLQGQLEKVVKQVPTTTVKSPTANAELQSLLGIAQFGLGKTDDAMAAFASAQKFVPGFPAAVLGDARVKAARGDLAGASAEVDQVLSKNPKQVEGLLRKGDIARAQSNAKDAIAAYDPA
ncbi:MAG: tetratricopeptide repeat protein, partial [Burkholderiaceae bacterium]